MMLNMLEGIIPDREAMLYYLYMMSDGEISYSEERLFNNICKEMGLDSESKELVISKCKKIASNPESAYKAIINEKLDEEIGKKLFMSYPDVSSRTRIIWNLVNLGHADSTYSENEMKIVNYFVGKWDIDRGIYQEILDIADTMLALTKQKEWVTNTIPKGKERDAKEKKIDGDLEKMISDLKITIKELSI